MERLLEPLEAFGDWRKGNAESLRLGFVPGCTDAQPGPAAGEDVECSDDLGEHPGMAIDRPGDDGEQPHLRGMRSRVTEGGVGLQHLSLGRADRADLEEVVHQSQELESGIVRGSGDSCQVPPQLGWAARPGEVGNLEAEFHAIPPAIVDNPGES